MRSGDVPALSIKLNKIAAKSTRALRRVHRDGSYKLRDVAIEMSPFKRGDLESSIDVEEKRETNGRKSFQIKATAKHAIFMHEGQYQLGPGSLAKQASSRFRVGRMFMFRAAQYIKYEWGLADKAKKAVRSAVRGR